MSRFTHSICDGCWIEREPYREPTRMNGRPIEICCFCGVSNDSGIYVRENPDFPNLKCKGKHDE